MREKFIITPEMEEGARKLEKEEKIRSGDEVPCPPAPGPEEYGSLNETADKAASQPINKIKLRPQPKFVKMPGAPKNMGWLKKWQDEKEGDEIRK